MDGRLKMSRCNSDAAAFGLKRVTCAPDVFAEAVGFGFPSAISPAPRFTLSFEGSLEGLRPFPPTSLIARCLHTANPSATMNP
jgi:hypothetical protein